ncbi:MAG: dihydrolipoyl dehydrogenase [Planctomycetaceae bacterium]|jgi:dihydrolipoamide dehydrogenase|nr:dihydrolipoyl dehydrogenase [Planctomycetaceae bacterium]
MKNEGKKGDENFDFDLIVIGGGPAGYTAAIHARQHSLTTALVEERELGGTCLNRGCIPTKALIDVANVLRTIRDAAKRGLDFTGADPSKFGVKMPDILKSKERMVKKMTTGIAVLLRENNVTTLSGTASLTVPKTAGEPFVVTVTKDGNSKQYKSRKVILATGSVPSELAIRGADSPKLADRIFNSDAMLDINFVPEKLIVIGGGVIGIELAQVFHEFGSKVQIVEMQSSLVNSILDTEIEDALKKSLNARGIVVRTDASIESIESTESGLRLNLTDGEKIEGTHILSAIGRKPDRRILDAIGVTETFVNVDERMRTKIPGLFAVGDINGQCMLAHAAMRMGRIAAISTGDELLGEQAGFEPELETLRRETTRYPELIAELFPFYSPIVIYGEPEVACIGLPEKLARQRFGNDIKVGHFPMAANGRAVASCSQEGFVKVVRCESNDRLIGVQIIGSYASEIINEASAVFFTATPLRQLQQALHAHPTFGEAFVEAVADSRGEAVHIPPKK